MAQKVFKGFMQVTEGNFTAAEGYIYFVRNSANTGATDGYLQFNGKKYGTAAELEADVNAKIGTLPEGYDNLVDYIDGQVSAITDNFSSESVTGSSNGVEVEIGQADGNVTAVTVTAPDFDATYAPISLNSAATRLDAIEADYLKAADKTELNNAITAETEAREALADRVEGLEAVSADTRLDALEEDTHTHENKDVLDGITQAKVNQWDGMSSGASVVLSAYTENGNPAATAGMLKTYEIFQGGQSVGKIDIPKDLVVTSGVVTTNGDNQKVLRLTIANQAEPVDILVSDLAHVYTQGNGIEISASDEVSAKVVAANGLSVDANGIAMALADGSNAGAMSAADFTKLGTIEASAQTNVIEEVKVDGTALTVTNKSVNIELPDYSDVYAPKADFEAVSGLVNTINSDYLDSADKTELNNAITAETAARESADNALDTRLDALEAISGDSHTHSNKAVLDGVTAEKVAAWDDAADKAHEHSNKAVLDGITAEKVSAWDGVAGSADTRISALEGVSADTRLDALEAISGKSHEHANKTVLDGITDGKVAAWDASEQNAKDYADGLKNGLNADVSGESNGVTVQVVQASGVVTDVNVTAPDFANTYAPIGVTSADTRIAALEASASTWNGVADSADTRLDALEAVDADTRLDALEALTASTSSALQSISAGDASVSVGTKDSNNDQSVAVAVSSTANNALSLNNDGLFAAIYYDGDDSN